MSKSRPTVSTEAREMGERLRKLITDNEMNQAEFAAKLDVSLDAVKKMVSGETLATYTKLPVIAKTLNSTPNDLFGIPAGYDAAVVLSAIEAYGQMLGAPQELAKKYAQTVLKVLQSPVALRTVDIDRGTLVRILIEQEFRRDPPKAAS